VLYEHGLIGTVVLVPQVADSVSIPVVAAGGIMDVHGILASYALGKQRTDGNGLSYQSGEQYFGSV